METWNCEYCNTLNPPNKTKCVYCNAPKADPIINASETWTRRTWLRDRLAIVTERPK